MNNCLGQVLEEKVVESAYLANDYVFAADAAVVADTDRVEDGS